MRKVYFSIILLLAVLLPACAPSAVETISDGGFVPAGEAAPEVYYPQEARADGTGGNAYEIGTTPAEIERIVIKNANLTIVVEDPSISVKDIAAMAEEMGGFVVSSNTYLSTLPSGAEVPRASITVRVPAERLNEAMDQIKSETSQPVMDETVTSQDVTEDYTDLQSRLRNLEAAEAQLQKIMEDTYKTDEVLAVYQQLTQVREQIEVTKGRIQFYERSAALSSISVELMANAAVQPLSVGGWQPTGIARQALQTLIHVLQILGNIVIYMVLLVLPVLIVILLPPALILWLILRWRASRKTKKATERTAS